MTLRLRNVQVDVPAEGFDAAVAFWAAALGGMPQDAGEDFTHLVGGRGLVGLHLQRLGAGRARVHLDLDADHPEEETGRLVRLGATPTGDGPCAVLVDPAGNLLCVCRGEGRVEQLSAEEDAARLHVLVIDAPTAHAAETAAFWGEALGVPAEHLPSPFEAYWRLEDVPVPGGAMRILVQDIGEEAEPRIHLDLHVPDSGARDAEVERLVGLGATVIDVGSHPWTVLTDPIGTVLCVVPDRTGS